jgi:hypothetical protein
MLRTIRGSTLLPYQSQGKFHLGGKVVTSPPDTFKKIIESVWTILVAKQDTNYVIIPPMPRYLFARCCNDPGHCTNAKDKEYSQSLLTDFLQLRNNLIRQLVAKGLSNFKFLDTCCTTTCTSPANTATRLAELRKGTAKDGVHFIAKGYVNMANRASACLKTLLAATPHTKKDCIHFWRGFKSPIGASPVHQRTPPAAHKLGASNHSRGNSSTFRGGPRQGYHPYHRN